MKEMATLADSFVQAQMPNKCKPQNEGYKPSVKGRSCFTAGNEGGWKPRHSPPQNRSRPGNPHHKPSVKEEGPRMCFQCNSTEHLRNQCPELKEAKPHPTHNNDAVLNTEAPEVASVHLTSFELPEF